MDQVTITNVTSSTSLPHAAANVAVDLNECTCGTNGMCKVCDAWQAAVRFYRAHPEMVKVGA